MTLLHQERIERLRNLNSTLLAEIRGQNHVIPRVVSVVQRGELGLSKAGRPRGSFLLLGPTGVGKTETVLVVTNQLFGSEQLFRFDMSEFQTQETLGLLLGARLGETGYLGAVRERAAAVDNGAETRHLTLSQGWAGAAPRGAAAGRREAHPAVGAAVARDGRSGRRQTSGEEERWLQKSRS